MKKIGLLSVFVLAAVLTPCTARERVPANMQSALIIKLLPMYTNLGSKEFKIHVIGAPDVAKELKASIGKSAGKAKLVAVTASDGVPSEKVDVIYVGADVAGGTGYAQSNGILSITGNPDLVEKGVTLSLTLENKKPRIILNLTSSKAEGIDWNPAILKVAKTIS